MTHRISSYIYAKLELILGFISSASSGVSVAVTNSQLDLKETIFKALLVAIITGTIGTLSGWAIKVTLIKYLKSKFKINE